MELTVLNRQRQVALGTVDLCRSFSRLLSGIVENLLRQPPDHLARPLIEAADRRASLSVVLVSDRAIRKLNKRFRGQDVPTDVISFPIDLYPQGSDLRPGSEVEGSGSGTSSRAGQARRAQGTKRSERIIDTPWQLGEVVISVETACKQAVSFGHSLERELAFLFVHGALHVLGFDHKTVKQDRQMRRRQAAVLGAAGIKR